MKKFKTNRDGYLKYLLLASVTLPVIVFILSGDKIAVNPIVLVLTLLPTAILLWVYFGTYYIVEKEQLLYQSAFLSGQVDIASITEISKGETSWMGIKPATAANGLLIKFNQYDEIYISPQNNDAMIAALKEINGGIKITEVAKR